MATIRHVLLILALVFFSQAQILAIDFGTQFIKAAVVNKGSGKAFSIVQTPKSERKFINTIGFYSQERFYESDAIPRRSKYPQNCFIFNKLLIDSILNPKLKSEIKKDLLLQYIKNDIEDPLLAEFTLQHFPPESSKVTLIQVVAMIIKYAKSNAEKQIKQQIKDVIITVPSYWNIKMRAFIIEAAQIADLYVLTLISQNSAAAINYALTQRAKNTTETILFYNLGSNALQLTIAEFKQVADQKSKPVESIFILGDFAKNYVGGLRFDSVLFNYFKKRFQTKYKKELNLRGSIKLWGQISEVKQVLSSNKDSPLYVQGIMDGIDLHDKITRTEFQEMIEPILKQVTTPIKRFLFDNNLRPDDIDNVQLIGGSMRIPKLQSMIGEIIGNQSKIGTHINADEAMVLGAAFYGANSSKKFKVKGINLYDGFNFQIRAVLKNLEQNIEQSDQRYFFKNVTVFHKKNRFGLTKQLNFKCKQNIVIELYKQDEYGLQLLRSTKLDSIKDVNETDFKVSILLSLDPIEVVSVKKAEIKYKKDEVVSYMQKIKKQAPKVQKKPQEQEQDEKQEQKQLMEKEESEKKQGEQKQEASEEKNEENQNEKQAQQQQNNKQKQQQKKKQEKKAEKKKKKKKQPKQQYQTVQRNKTVTKKYQKDLRMQQIFSRQKADHETLQKSRKMLKQYQRVEEQRKKLAESKNKLEALIYEIKDRLDNEQFLQFVQSTEKENLEKLLAEKSQWYDDTVSNVKSDYDEQSKGLAKPLDKIKKRIHEYQSRQVHVKKALHSIKEYRDLSLNITKKKEWITEDQIDQLVQKIDESKKQIQNMFQKMEDTPQNENCIFQIKDVEKVVEKAKQQYFRVMATPKPKKQKKVEKEEQKQKEQKSADQSQQL